MNDGSVRRVHAHIQRRARAGGGENAALQIQRFVRARACFRDGAGHEIPEAELLPGIGAVVGHGDAHFDVQRGALRIHRYIHGVEKAGLALGEGGEQEKQRREKKQRRAEKGAHGGKTCGMHGATFLSCLYV